MWCVGKRTMAGHIKMWCVGKRTMAGHIKMWCVDKRTMAGHIKMWCVGERTIAGHIKMWCVGRTERWRFGKMRVIAHQLTGPKPMFILDSQWQFLLVSASYEPTDTRVLVLCCVLHLCEWADLPG